MVKKIYWEQANNTRTVTHAMAHPADGWSRLQGVCQTLSIKAQSHQNYTFFKKKEAKYKTFTIQKVWKERYQMLVVVGF